MRVIPRAKRDQVAGTRDGALLVRLAAPPLEGAANDALLAFLARVFDMPARSLTLVSGQRSRHKRIHVAGLTAASISERLAQALS